jgi:2-methylisocitrate lyase-like PEP mutase family enzyme
LVLPNAWDAGSAVIFEKEGFEAIGTTSAGIAYSLGYPDGENITLPDLLEAAQKIIRRITVPLTVDIEMGYGADISQVLNTVQSVIEEGAVGINIEDGVNGEYPHLFDCQEQCRKVEEIKRLKAVSGVPFVINARTDVYWLSIGEPERRLHEAIERGNAYLEAGADCVFVPGRMGREVIGDLAKEIKGPLNIIATPLCPNVAELEALGVSRLSIGSGAVRASLGITRRIARELKAQGSLTSMIEAAISYGEANKLFSDKLR